MSVVVVVVGMGLFWAFGCKPQRNEEEEENKGSTNADSNYNPHVEAKDYSALGELIVDDGRVIARH